MSNILQWVMNHKWAMMPDTLQAMIELVENRLDQKFDIKIDDPKKFHLNDFGSINALQSQFGKRMDGANYTNQRGTTAILPIVGPLFPRASWFTMSGGMSVTAIAKELNIALKSAEIESVILNIDSPGGEVTGISELSDMIMDANKIKPVLSYVYGFAASAAYWIATAGSEIIGSNTSEVGSIGVVAGYVDRKEADKKNGIKTIEIVSSQSPNKRPDVSTDEGRGQIQIIVNDLADLFINAVAVNRKVGAEDVRNNFGKGGMFVAGKAVQLGMIDRVGTLEKLIEEQNAKFSNNNQFLGGSGMSITYESLKQDHPALFAQVSDEGKKTGKAEGVILGREEENARIQKIEAINAPDSAKIIAGHKFDMNQTAETISLAVLESQSAKIAAQRTNHEADAVKTAIETENISTQEFEDGVATQAEMDEAVKEMLD